MEGKKINYNLKLSLSINVNNSLGHLKNVFKL